MVKVRTQNPIFDMEILHSMLLHEIKLRKVMINNNALGQTSARVGDTVSLSSSVVKMLFLCIRIIVNK